MSVATLIFIVQTVSETSVQYVCHISIQWCCDQWNAVSNVCHGRLNPAGPTNGIIYRI